MSWSQRGKSKERGSFNFVTNSAQDKFNQPLHNPHYCQRGWALLLGLHGKHILTLLS